MNQIAKRLIKENLFFRLAVKQAKKTNRFKIHLNNDESFSYGDIQLNGNDYYPVQLRLDKFYFWQGLDEFKLSLQLLYHWILSKVFKDNSIYRIFNANRNFLSIQSYDSLKELKAIDNYFPIPDNNSILNNIEEIQKRKADISVRELEKDLERTGCIKIMDGIYLSNTAFYNLYINEFEYLFDLSDGWSYHSVILFVKIFFKSLGYDFMIELE